jgi:hypothetical protein
MSSLLVLLFAVPAAAAGPGMGMGGGACLQQNVWTGEPFEVEGTVTSTAPRGTITVSESDGGSMLVMGLGPPWFWRDLGVDMPGVGDGVEVEGRTLDCGAGPENVATSITVGGETVELRDPTTGLPLWMSGRGGPWRAR